MSTSICEEIREELVAYLAGEQPESERARIAAHAGTCLSCRRELDQLSKVDALLASLPRIEPSPDFEERMWQRLRADAPEIAKRRRFRPAAWGLPALAAAAVLALVWYASLSRETLPVPQAPGAKQVAQAPGAPAQSDPAPMMKAEAESGALKSKAEGESDSTIAQLSPEDLPPELLERPELFLRYPVVRRLNKLKAFEEVRQRISPDETGRPAPEGPVG